MHILVKIGILNKESLTRDRSLWKGHMTQSDITVVDGTEELQD